MAEKFFSEAWLEHARLAEQAGSDTAYKALKDPSTFTHVLAFEINEHPDVITHMTYVEGRCVKWTATDLSPEDEVWARFRGNLEHYREVLEGRTSAANLVMAGKLRVVKGTMADAVENAQPLNLLMKAWGAVETDWDL